MSKVTSRVPRGFTRFYVLQVLKEGPMTGKGIIEEAERRSEGDWRPSPGLIYPLLGRLLREGLIEEGEGGRFTITPEGDAALEQYTGIQRQLEKQLRVVKRLGLSMLTTGKFLAEDALDRIMVVTERANEMVAKGSKDLQRGFYTKYRSFLERELERLKEEPPEGPDEKRRQGADPSNTC